MIRWLFFSILIPNLLVAQSDTTSRSMYTFGLNSEVTYALMEQNQNLRKIDLLIDARAQDKVAPYSLNLGFSIIALADYQRTNKESKFGYLMRHPTSANQIGRHVSEVSLHSAQVSLIASLDDWITAYGELLYNSQQSFGAGTITSLTRNQVQLSKGLVVLGNTRRFPLFLTIGKMDVPFAQTGSVSPFTNSMMWHAFGILAYGAILRYEQDGLSISVAPIQGGAQFRAAQVPVEGTNVPSRLNNFAIDIRYTYNLGAKNYIQFGCSYLKGSAYCQSWPVAHFNSCDENNPAFSIYGEAQLFDRLLIKGGYAQTVKEWPGTFNPNPPLNIFEAAKVSSMDLGARYIFSEGKKIDYSVSAEFSNFRSGPEGAPWERQSQIVLGLNAQVQKTSRVFVELFHTTGYVPLNFISGGNFDNPGLTHSDRYARSFGIIGGAMVSI